jgi:RHS repeat-associated protein
VGNRLTQQVCVSAGNCVTTNYTYDNANRLATINGVPQTWDNNGNLTNDGSTSYTYDAANRLKTVTQGANSYSYVYNGTGDRLQQTANSATTTYTLDLTAGLTQVLGDGTNTYLYGYERIAQNSTANGKQYFLNDSLGSVRRVTNTGGAPTLTRSYEPYGKVLGSSGSGSTAYGFAGEWADNTGLIHLRACYYAPGVGRFVQRDPWAGDELRPSTLTKYLYAADNPIQYIDPTGQCPQPSADSGDVICVDLFIQTSTILFGLGKGDGRSFSSNSLPDQSRGYLYIYLDNKSKFKFPQQYVNPSCFTFTTGCFGPYPQYNKFEVRQDPASLDITVTWDLLNGLSGFLRKDAANALWLEGHGICNVLSVGSIGVSYTIPSINGELTLGMKQISRINKGHQWYVKHLDRDPYPSLEIYYYFNGSLAYTIDRRGEWPLEHPEIGLAPPAPNDTVP